MNPRKWWGAAAGPLASAAVSALLSGWAVTVSRPGPHGALFVILHLLSKSVTHAVYPAFVRPGRLFRAVVLLWGCCPQATFGRLRAGGGSAPRGQGCGSAPRSAQDRASAVPRPGRGPCVGAGPRAESSKHENGQVSARRGAKSLLSGKEMGT